MDLGSGVSMGSVGANAKIYLLFFRNGSECSITNAQLSVKISYTVLPFGNLSQTRSVFGFFS